ncbi:MAG: alcohol dehydrogenase catalytic domain-containing protein [Anaerolineae bacterium]|nr:alcohol dehydrogenase catalytic domain-containing protein [Anaerolineae bacterium]
MKAALFYGGHDIRVEEVPDPVPGPGEVLVRVKAGGVCGSDLHAYRATGGVTPGSGPMMRGHELAGEIAQLGLGVHGLTVGQRVGVEPRHLVGCGQCRWCRRGDTQLCPTRGWSGDQRLWSTGFAEYSLEPAQNTYPLPDALGLREAALLDVYACAVHALHLAPVTPGEIVVVQGAGPIGLAAVEIYKLGGAKEVIVCDLLPHALEAAMTVGADAVVNSGEVDAVEAVRQLTAGDGADIVVEAVGGRAPTFAADVSMAARGGTVIVIGMYSDPQTLDVREAQHKELRILFSDSYGLWKGVPEFQITLDLMAAGRLKPEAYITHAFPLVEIGQAFTVADNKRTSGAIKVMVLP